MKYTIPIIVEMSGYKNGAEFFEEHLMEAPPEESLASIVDRIPTKLDDIKVKMIRFK